MVAPMMRFLAWFFTVLGVVLLGIAIYGFVEEWTAGPDLVLEKSSMDVGTMPLGQTTLVEARLHNRGHSDKRVVGECFA